MSFVFDVGTLASLRQNIRAGHTGAHQKLAQQFEGLFLQMMLKSMREASPKEGLFDSDQARMLQSVFDAQISQQLSERGLGLAKVLLAHLQRHGAAQIPGSPASAKFGTGTGESGETRRIVGDGGLAGRSLSVRDTRLTSTPFTMLPEYAASAATMHTADTRSLDQSDTHTGLPAHVAQFVARLLKPAKAVAQASGLPLKLILGQAALESGWGQREIQTPDGRPTHNLFGIKATGGWAGKVVDVLTTEFIDGRPVKMQQPFRAYASYEQALQDYANLITRSPRYREVTNAQDAYDAARKIQAAGYATDPNYADKLIRVMQRLPVAS